MKTSKILPYIILLAFLSCKKEEPISLCEKRIENLTINQIQTIGSHNSYRTATYPPLFDYIKNLANLFPNLINPDDLDYTHEPLDVQFDQYKIRSIELDVYYDPDGGLFYNRMGLQFINTPVASNIPELQEPGLKVLHIPDIDYETNYYTFKTALQEVKNWSDANSNHLPITILIEPKEEAINDALELPIPSLTQPKEFTALALSSIDEEIKNIFGNDLSNIITPDKVRNQFATLEEAILAKNWPSIEASRGKVLFLMIASAEQQALYLENHPSLTNRIMFVFSTPGNPECAFIKYNDPLGSFNQIQEHVAKGYMIRTRADADTKEARSGDRTRQIAAIESGAHIISTDYYRPDSRYLSNNNWTDYSVQFPNGEVALINPINTTSEILECTISE